MVFVGIELLLLLLELFKGEKEEEVDVVVPEEEEDEEVEDDEDEKEEGCKDLLLWMPTIKSRAMELCTFSCCCGTPVQNYIFLTVIHNLNEVIHY